MPSVERSAHRLNLLSADICGSGHQDLSPGIVTHPPQAKLTTMVANSPCSRIIVIPRPERHAALTQQYEIDELDVSTIAASLINLCRPSYLRDRPNHRVRTRTGDYGVAFSAPCVKARPVAEMSSPAPAAV
jgi:hypothetical protein